MIVEPKRTNTTNPNNKHTHTHTHTHAHKNASASKKVENKPKLVTFWIIEMKTKSGFKFRKHCKTLTDCTIHLLKSYPKMAAMIAATNATGLELEEQFLKAVELGDVAEVQRLLEAGVNVCYVDKVTTRCVRITPYSRLKSSMGVDFRMAILPSTRPVEMEMQGL
jgi:hypothetical protein